MRGSHAVECLRTAELSRVRPRTGQATRTPAGRRRPVAMDSPWVEPFRQLIQQHPTFGYRHMWAVLRGQMPHRVSKDAVYRVLRRISGWCISGHVPCDRACRG